MYYDLAVYALCCPTGVWCIIRTNRQPHEGGTVVLSKVELLRLAWSSPDCSGPYPTCTNEGVSVFYAICKLSHFTTPQPGLMHVRRHGTISADFLWTKLNVPSGQPYQLHQLNSPTIDSRSTSWACSNASEICPKCNFRSIRRHIYLKEDSFCNPNLTIRKPISGVDVSPSWSAFLRLDISPWNIDSYVTDGKKKYAALSCKLMVGIWRGKRLPLAKQH